MRHLKSIILLMFWMIIVGLLLLALSTGVPKR